MENPQNFSTTDNPQEILLLTTQSATYLVKAAKWGKFMAILGFIITGLMLVAAFAMLFVLNRVSDELMPVNLPFPVAFMSIVYFLFAAIFVTPVIFLNSFCNNAIKAVNLSSVDNLSISLRNLKNLFLFTGLATVILLAIYSAVVIIAATAALVSV